MIYALAVLFVLIGTGSAVYGIWNQEPSALGIAVFAVLGLLSALNKATRTPRYYYEDRYPY